MATSLQMSTLVNQSSSQTLESQKTQNQNQSQSTPSQQKKQKYTKASSPSNTGGQKETRNAKRKRWAKKNGVKPKATPNHAPVKSYTSKCCNAPATKPPAGQKSMEKNPESGKVEKSSKGLGSWRCTVCKKRCAVIVGKPKEEENAQAQPTQV
jgi:hypothetical protein